MRRYLMSPKWWVGHLLVLALAVVFVRLGIWQWDRAHAGGGAQNLGYALQWPLFAVFVIAGWARILWLEQHPQQRRARSAAKPAKPPPPPPQPRPTRPPPAEEDEPDDELAAYNAYLAHLAARDRRA